MELGSSHNEFIDQPFEELEQWVEELYHRAQERSLLTASEMSQLKKVKQKILCYPNIQIEKLDSVERRIRFLISRYSSYYDA